MRLVVDANILFSFFKKDSFTRRFILSHPEIEQISPDPDDVEYLAVALSLDCAIWSNDKDLKEEQSRVVVVTTDELTKLLGSSLA